MFTISSVAVELFNDHKCARTTCRVIVLKSIDKDDEKLYVTVRRVTLQKQPKQLRRHFVNQGFEVLYSYTVKFKRCSTNRNT